MSPTNLGDLSSNQPAPTGYGMVKRGVTDTYTDYSSSNAAGTVFPDGSSGYMQIQTTPTRRCYWLVTGEMIWTSPDAIWSRSDFGLRLSPADLDGRSAMARAITAVHASVPWQLYSTSMMWRLEANTAYTCSMTWEYSSGYWHKFSTHPQWHKIMGLLIAEAEA